MRDDGDLRVMVSLLALASLILGIGVLSDMQG